MGPSPVSAREVAATLFAEIQKYKMNSKEFRLIR